MKQIVQSLAAITFGFTAIVSNAEVPNLADSIQALDATSFNEFQESIAEVETVITADVDFALDTAVVNEALEQGLISESEAADLGSALETIENNAEFFDFDVAAFLADGMAIGAITAAQANEVLTAFSQLSPEGKAVVGAESFSAFDLSYGSLTNAITACGGTCDGDDLLNGVTGHTAAQLQSAEFESLSTADKSIVAGVSLTFVE